jgi:H+-transporting ATPase
MVTGDALAIARETAKKLGMGTEILDASILGDAKHKETADETAAIEKADGFAQVFPEHKFRIVDTLQRHGHIVGMTGDGVNDAPALKQADCGIAVSGATDAARAAAAIVLMTPGLSVIIDAIKESRRIFQRMNSYAIYRIAETLRVLFFMTLAILVFNFYPLTAVMIVMLALLNDGAILAIAYDNVHYRDKPEAWNMRSVLGIATVLGVFGVIAAFGLFYLAERVFHLDRPHIQTLMYLKLSVAGHLTIFLTRTRGPFWSIRPARVLWIAVLGTQVVATTIAVLGIFMTPLPWRWALFVWGYALAWALVNDRVKLLAYWVLDRFDAKSKPKVIEAKPEAKMVEAKPEAKVVEAKPEAKAEAKPEAKAEAKPEAKVEAKPEAKAEDKGANVKPTQEVKPKPGTKADSATLLNMTLGDVLLAGLVKDPEDAGRMIAQAITAEAATPAAKPERDPDATEAPKPATPQIAKRAYELYEQGGRKEGGAAGDWERAEQQIRKSGVPK